MGPDGSGKGFLEAVIEVVVGALATVERLRVLLEERLEATEDISDLAF